MADSPGYDTALHDSLPDSPVPSSHKYESGHSEQETHPEFAAQYVTSITGTELAEHEPYTSAALTDLAAALAAAQADLVEHAASTVAAEAKLATAQENTKRKRSELAELAAAIAFTEFELAVEAASTSEVKFAPCTLRSPHSPCCNNPLYEYH